MIKKILFALIVTQFCNILPMALVRTIKPYGTLAIPRRSIHDHYTLWRTWPLVQQSFNDTQKSVAALNTVYLRIVVASSLPYTCPVLNDSLAKARRLSMAEFAHSMNGLVLTAGISDQIMTEMHGGAANEDLQALVRFIKEQQNKKANNT